MTRFRQRDIIKWHAQGHDYLDGFGVPRFDESQSPVVEYTIAQRISMLVAAERERSRGLEAAVRAAEWNVEDGFEPDSAVLVKRSSWNAIQDALASLSAVPEVQDDDGYEARSASPGAARQGQDVDAQHREIIDGEIAYSERLGDVFLRLLDASASVPIKQRNRTPEQQAAVEAFTTAVVEARKFAREGADVDNDPGLPTWPPSSA